MYKWFRSWPETRRRLSRVDGVDLLKRRTPTEAEINIISNTFSDFKDNAIASAMNYQCSFNPIDKIVELYEALVKSEKEKVEMLQRLLDQNK